MYSTRQSVRVPRIGDVYTMCFQGYGSEQQGWRPGVVFQNNTGNLHSPNIIALPLTTSLKKLNLPTHVLIKASDSGLRYDSVVLCENPEKMSKCKLGSYLTTLSDDTMREIATASLLATSAISFLDKDSLLEAWQKASVLNTVSTN